jgi:hypothetical protein
MAMKLFTFDYLLRKGRDTASFREMPESMGQLAMLWEIWCKGLSAAWISSWRKLAMFWLTATCLMSCFKPEYLSWIDEVALR